MTRLHEVLAAEPGVLKSWSDISAETLAKMGRPQHFEGETVSLSMLGESEDKFAVEAAGSTEKQMQTTVLATLEYALKFYGNAEDILLARYLANTKATADLMFRGTVLFEKLPVDLLIQLDTRLGKVREAYVAMPTLDASKAWTYDPNLGCQVAAPEVSLKTEKTMTAVQLSPATDKHPAQIEKVFKDVPVGKFTRVKRSGAVTALQKANAISLVDELIGEAKMALQRANCQEVEPRKVGAKLVELLLSPFK